MTVAILYVATAAIFLALDALMLRLVIAPLFRSHLGDMLLAEMRFVPAALFYLAYVAGLVWLVSLPAVKTGAPVVLPAAIIGAMAYGTYEFTNYATLGGWHPAMVATDLVWGTVLTAFSAWAGVWIARSIAG